MKEIYHQVDLGGIDLHQLHHIFSRAELSHLICLCALSLKKDDPPTEFSSCLVKMVMSLCDKDKEIVQKFFKEKGLHLNFMFVPGASPKDVH